MNQDLNQIITYYATKPHKVLNELLLNKSKDNLIAILTDLLTAYINDKNSSSLREFITVSIAGYQHISKKLGYNGYKQNSAIGSKPISCEAKPKNIQTEGYELKKSKPKLNGEGGFNDYTIERLNKDVKEKLNLLSSGFIDGELQYIIEFPFKAVYNKLREQLPERRIVGTYTRMASFNFSHYSSYPVIKIIYLNKNAIERNQQYFNKKFYQFLIDSK
ncbi:MAG TPA: hypothetical protein PKI98_09680 [Chitinophagaceae bacterium]|nr:hypothetical protein [Chitinophagaceae bacterium]HNJ59193.1 hypothetical protein [Chitinophagaceae bacterium]HNM35146.1 hypothetical protein [Chitinophagaceae bacterium]